MTEREKSYQMTIRDAMLAARTSKKDGRTQWVTYYAQYARDLNRAILTERRKAAEK